MSIMDINHSSCSVTVMVEAELVAALTNLPDFNTGNFRFSQELPLSLAIFLDQGRLNAPHLNPST